MSWHLCLAKVWLVDPQPKRAQRLSNQREEEGYFVFHSISPLGLLFLLRGTPCQWCDEKTISPLGLLFLLRGTPCQWCDERSSRVTSTKVNDTRSNVKFIGENIHSAVCTYTARLIGTEDNRAAYFRVDCCTYKNIMECCGERPSWFHSHQNFHLFST